MLPRRRSTPSISLRAPPASTLPAKRSAAMRAPRGRIAGHEQRRAPVHRLAEHRPSIASAPTGSPSTAKKPPLTPATADVRRAIELGRSSPATRSFDSTPPSRPSSAVAVDRQDVHAPRPALAGDRGPAHARRDRGAVAPLVERARAQRQLGGQGCAGRAGREQGKQDAGAPAHGPQGGRPAAGCRVASRAAGSSPGCGCRRGRRRARRTGSCPWTCPRRCSS